MNKLPWTIEDYDSLRVFIKDADGALVCRVSKDTAALIVLAVNRVHKAELRRARTALTKGSK